jgi:hypothetical protein
MILPFIFSGRLAASNGSVMPADSSEHMKCSLSREDKLLGPNCVHSAPRPFAVPLYLLLSVIAYSGGWSPNWVHSAPRPFTVQLYLVLSVIAYSGGWSPNWVYSAPRPFAVLLYLVLSVIAYSGGVESKLGPLGTAAIYCPIVPAAVAN